VLVRQQANGEKKKASRSSLREPPPPPKTMVVAVAGAHRLAFVPRAGAAVCGGLTQAVNEHGRAGELLPAGARGGRRFLGRRRSWGRRGCGGGWMRVKLG